MSLFTRTEQEKRDHALAKSKKSPDILGDLSGLSLPFKPAEKNELDRDKIIQRLEIHRKIPVRLLE
ncbi:MAG: hypothetical protein OQK95_12320, partial [Gammaproteobacteria bacterium]|nr:hypothetical protein [Gammaproteobacteria bacterium]